MTPARRRFDAVVFDMDGLLLDTERPVRDAWLEAAASVGMPIAPDDYLRVVGLNHAASTAQMLDWLGGDPARLALARARASATLAARASSFEVKPGVRALLDRLRRAGLPCAVATSTWRVDALPRLAAAGLLDRFDRIGTGDEVVRGKPAPDLYRLVVDRLGSRPERTLAFEDSNPGVQAALAAGLAVVNVPDLVPAEPLWQARCLAVWPTLEFFDAHADDWFGAPLAAGAAVDPASASESS